MILVIILLAGNLNSKNSDSNFELNTVLLKSVIEYGEDISSVIKITNVKNFEQEFSVRVNGLDGLVDLNDDNFVLNSGESKELIVSFYDKELNYLPSSIKFIQFNSSYSCKINNLNNNLRELKLPL